MKVLTLFLLSLTVGWSSAYLIKVPTIATQPRIAPLGWVHIQKLMLPLFENVCEDSTNAMIVQLAKDFTLDSTNGDFTKTGVVEYLRNLKTSKGLLPKGQIFTEFNADHVNELRAVFEMLYYAKDFDTFYRAAAWARQNINCGLFVDAIYLAIVNRRDTEKISVPAPYELMPNYFINRDVVVKASFLLNGDDMTPSEDVRIEGNSYILDAKYTAEIDDSDEDAKLAYFREDIGLNAYYFVRKLRNSPWITNNSPSDTDNFYGERMFLMMKQFAARYDLERYANELPELEGFTWDSTFTSYDPMLIYSNGNEFDRKLFTEINDNEDLTFLKTIENNIASVVTHLRQAGYSKSQILNHLVELLVASDKSYETVFRKVLGYDTSVNQRQCSVLEHYMTTMRDPIFWHMNKKIVQMIDNAIKVLPPYTRTELYFPGVEVMTVDIKKMMTSFDNFQFDVTDSLKAATVNTTFQVKISQTRLNHKPFMIKLNISSLVTKKAFVKIYLGPKMMPGELASKKHLFVLLDMFEFNLKRGSNVLSRSSEQMTSFSDDFMSLRTLRKKVEDAEFGLDALPLKTVESQIGYPSRLILPKGLPGGLPLQMFVFVAPFTKGTIGGSTSMSNMELNSAILSPGYPLDLTIETRQLFGLPNAYVKDIVITHKSEAKPNGGYGGRPSPNKPYDYTQTDFTMNGDGYSAVPQEVNIDEYNYDDSLLVHGLLGDRPDFTYKNSKTGGYSPKKNQYRQKNDFSSQRTDYRKINNDKPDAYKKSDSKFKLSESNIGEDNFMIDVDQTNDYNRPVHGLLGERPAFTYKNKDTAGYSGNKNQYRKKEDYATKRTQYRKVDLQDRDNENVTENKHFSIIQDPLVVYDKTFIDKTDNRVITPRFHYEDTIIDEFDNNDKLPKHGLLGKSSDDYNVVKNKYQTKKENYVQKAETKRIDYRKKAFDKKAKIGVLDYTLLEKPEEPTKYEYVDTENKNDEYSGMKGDKIIKNVSEKTINKEIVGDKQIKDVKNKSVFKEIDGDTITKFITDKSVRKNIVDGKVEPNKNVLNNKDMKFKDAVTFRNDENANSIFDTHSTERYLNQFNGITKTINKEVNKNKDETIMPRIKKDKYFSKTEKDFSKEIADNVFDKFTKKINKDIINNNDETIVINKENDKYKDMDESITKIISDKSVYNNIEGNKTPSKVKYTSDNKYQKDKDIVMYDEDDNSIFKTHPKEGYLNLFDFMTKTVNKDKDSGKKDKYFSKTEKDLSKEEDDNVYDKVTKTINKDLTNGKDETIEINKTDGDHISITVKDVSGETDFDNKEGFTKTIHKDVDKYKDESTVLVTEEGDELENTKKDSSIEIFINEYQPKVTTERTMKRVSVYDFIFNPFNQEDEDDTRVYE